MMEALVRASARDAEEVYALYRAAAAHGRARGSSDWDDDYPAMANILSDLEAHGLFVLRREGRIVAAISAVPPVDLEELEEYAVPWTPARAVELCRFCVSPEAQGTGLAKRVFLSILEILRAEGIEAVRYLCAKANPAAYRLYTSLGHRQLGEVRHWETDFYCFEQVL